MAKRSKQRDRSVDDWEAARHLYGLSARQVRMARELGLNPRRFSKYATPSRSRWKEPLGTFIERLYQREVVQGRTRAELRREKAQVDDCLAIARAAKKRGDLETAAAVMRDAAGLLIDRGRPEAAGCVQRERGELLSLLGDHRGAKRAWRKAVECFEKAGAVAQADALRQRLSSSS